MPIFYLDEYPRESVVELKRAAGEALEYLRTDGEEDYFSMPEAYVEVLKFTEELVTRLDDWGY